MLRTKTSSNVPEGCTRNTLASSTWSSGIRGDRCVGRRILHVQDASGQHSVPTQKRIMHHGHRGGTDETRHHWMWQEQGLGQEPQCWTAEGQRCIHWPIFWDQQAVR